MRPIWPPGERDSRFSQTALKMGSRPNLMTSGSELSISAEGIFITCFQGQTRLWEVHPDDITSIGAYFENGRLHEVIVAVIHDYDVAEGTSGLKELNERLSRELETEIRVDSKHGTSPLGVVLWPPHLAGNALWEFFILGKDGLGTGVSPDTPNALRQLYKPLRREMARYAKSRLPVEFPQPLIDRGFAYHGEIGWCIDDAVQAAEWFRGREAAIVAAELWLVKTSVVQPHIQTKSGVLAYNYSTTTLPSETWEAFVSRSSNDATAFIRQFRWPENATEPVEQDVRFSLDWAWKEWLEDDGFTFPK
jgi:hypothetical protein